VVQAFAAELETVLGRPVRLFDERLTTTVAEQMMRDMGIKPEKRKARIDEIAAMIILQDYLDHQRSQYEHGGAQAHERGYSEDRNQQTGS
jgi:putative Holliday junction resolvase